MINIEEVYIWLSIIDNLDYITYIKLIKVFNSTIDLYNISKNKIKFEDILNQANIKLSEKLKSNILNSNLKLKSNEIYNYLKNHNVHIIPLNSKYYPDKLKNIFSPPLCIFITGNIELINKKKIFVYENINLSVYAHILKNYIYTKIIDYKEVLVLDKNLKIKPISLLKNYYNIKQSNYNTNQLNIYFNVNDILRSKIRNIEVVAGLLDLLVIPEADYLKDIVILVDSMLENGKNIVVFPNEIFNKNAYFSNYLIKNGANMITNINEIKEILKE